jgi:hypothetical protein
MTKTINLFLSGCVMEGSMKEGFCQKNILEHFMSFFGENDFAIKRDAN